MRKYETLYIVDAKLNDQELEPIIHKYKKIVEEQGGKINSAAKWDKRKLAYMIGNHKQGNYILMEFESNPEVPKELARLMRISDDIIRYTILHQEVSSEVLKNRMPAQETAN